MTEQNLTMAWALMSSPPLLSQERNKGRAAKQEKACPSRDSRRKRIDALFNLRWKGSDCTTHNRQGGVEMHCPH